MLPKTHHASDRRYIQTQLARLPYAYRVKACEGYSSAWTEAYESEPELRHKENEARRAANLRLRAYVDKVVSR